jgi:hypothetical protein
MTVIAASFDPVLPLATFIYTSSKGNFTMATKTKTRKTRKTFTAKMRDHNWRLYDKVAFPKAIYDLSISLELSSLDDIHAPEEFIASMENYHGIKRREIESMLMGAGTDLTTGVRDLHFMGYFDEIDAIMDTFVNTGEWKIRDITVSLADMDDAIVERSRFDRIAKRRGTV